MSIAACQGVCPTCRYDHSEHVTALASGSGEHAELIEDAMDALQIIDAFPSNQGEVEGRITEKGDRMLSSCTRDVRRALETLLAGLAALRAEGKARAKAHAKEIAGLYGRANTAEGELDAVSSAIGTVRFMDPPDGGDVPLSEQVRRMASALTEAERKLVEAVGLLRKFHDAWRSGCGWLPPMNAPDDEITAFLSKEAERG